MRAAWLSNIVLPDYLPGLILQHDSQMPAETREKIADRVGLQRADLLSTHPASGDRIGCARRAAEPGVFSLEVPARELFSNFDVLAQQVTLLHYTDDLAIPRPMIRVRPAGTFFAEATPAPIEEANTEHTELLKTFGPGKLKLKTANRET
jgi:hypothetical protein